LCRGLWTNICRDGDCVVNDGVCTHRCSEFRGCEDSEEDPASGEGCDSLTGDWTEVNGRCMTRMTNSLNWQQARDACEMIEGNGLLAVIESAAVQTAFRTAFTGNDRTGWIGLNCPDGDCENTNNFRWVDPNEATPSPYGPGYSNWGTIGSNMAFLTPTNVCINDGINNNCCVFMTRNAFWDATDCSSTQRFFCQRDMP